MQLKEFRQLYTFDVTKDFLGTGGQGKVVKAWDETNSEFVAIKIAEVPQSPFERFSLLNEYTRAKEIAAHKHIVHYKSCHRFTTDSGVFDYAVLQYYERGSLADVLNTETLSSKQQRTIAIGILDGLAHLHQHLVHRDIKPSNILISVYENTFIPKIADFGISKEFKNNDDLYISNTLKGGTIAYAALEQLEGNFKLTPSADLWSFGVILFEMTVGKHPFTDELESTSSDAKRIEILKRIRCGISEADLALVPIPFRSAIAACIVLDTSKRAVSAAAVKPLLMEPMIYNPSLSKDLTLQLIDNQFVNKVSTVPEPLEPSIYMPVEAVKSSLIPMEIKEPISLPTHEELPTNLMNENEMVLSLVPETATPIPLPKKTTLFETVEKRLIEAFLVLMSLSTLLGLFIFKPVSALFNNSFTFLLIALFAIPILTQIVIHTLLACFNFYQGFKKKDDNGYAKGMVFLSACGAAFVAVLMIILAMSSYSDLFIYSILIYTTICSLAINSWYYSIICSKIEPKSFLTTAMSVCMLLVISRFLTSPPKKTVQVDTEPIMSLIPMVKIESTRFSMGSVKNYANEAPVHTVKLEAYWISKHEVNVKEYLKFCNATNGHYPVWLEPDGKYHIQNGTDMRYKNIGYDVKDSKNDNLPIVGIDWLDAMAYCKWLSEQTGYSYRLPTEAEWEYAAKANQHQEYSGSANLETVGWYADNSDKKLHECGKKASNAFDIHDMTGNVMEWCADTYDVYASNEQSNPTGAPTGLQKVVRGGSYDSSAKNCHLTIRTPTHQGVRLPILGFRVVHSSK